MAQGFTNDTPGLVYPVSVALGGTGVTTSTGTGATVRGTAPTLNQANLVGVTTNSSAAAGSVGEVISSIVLFASSVSLTTGVSRDITSISLTAGDWDIFGNVSTTTSALSSVSAAWTSTSSATIPDASLYSNITVAGSGAQFAYSVPTLPLSLAGTTTVYLTVYGAFSTGTMSACGRIYARRVR